MPKFVDLNGNIKKSRLTASKSVSLDDIEDKDRLGKLLTDILSRLQALEANKEPDYVEFEKDVGASGSVTLEHNFDCPVRFSVTSWKASSGAPSLRLDETNSTTKKLVLTSSVAGRATIRVEQCQHNLVKGT